MKKRLCTLVFSALIALFSATLVSAAETGYGWTVGDAYNGSGSILYTKDSGQNWTYQGAGQIANVHLGGVFAVNGRTAYVVGDAAGGYGTIYRTTDAGGSWTRLGSATDIPNVELAKVHSYGNQKIWAVGAGTILHSSDGGASWNNTCPAAYSAIPFQGVTTTDGQHVWVTGGNKDGYATILYSADGGASWTRQGTAGDVTALDHVIGVAAADNKKLWAVGGGIATTGNVVLATTDSGAHWFKVHDGGLGDGNEVSVVNASTIWTAMDSHVLRTIDGGANWEGHSTASYTMGISGINTNQAWAVVFGVRDGAIYYTADGGATPWNVTLMGPDGANLPRLFTVSMSTTTKEAYPQAVENAKAHADAPAGWVAAAGDMVKVSGAASVGANPYGLKYYGDPANNQLIVRTLSSGNAYNGAWGTTTTAGANYSIYGSKTAMSNWVTTGNGMTGFIDGQGLTADTVVKGLERGLGMNTAGTHDAIFEMAVTVGDTANPYLLRPTRNPDPTVYSTTASDYGTYGAFPADAQAAGIGTGPAANAVYANYKAAYANWAQQAYSASPFPWTQLGYTYYWGQVENVPANLADVQGMSEFILLGGTGNSDPTKTPSGTNESGKVVTIGIYAPQSYLYTKNDGSRLSDALGAQYGNGFASFNVTGACDTLWAGAAFQVGAHLDAVSPNTITVGAGGSVSGGQGILVGSQNYTVTNAGLITANADTKKFNLTGSENIALLFKGDTHAAPYVGAVKNTLINSGTITAPGANGIAVAAWAGDTDITNTGTITGTGTGYAIKTASGNDTVQIDGGDVSGRIDLGTGIDALVVRTGASVSGEVTTGDRATVTVNGGTLNMTGGVINANGITGGNNADIITLSGGAINGDIRTGDGKDKVKITGGVVNGGTTAIQTGDGKDKVTVKDGTITGGEYAIQTGAGDDKVKINGGVVSGGTYAIHTGEGDDTLTVNDGKIIGRIDMGAGTDTLIVSGKKTAKFIFTLNRDNAASAQVANAETVAIAAGTKVAVRIAGTSNIRNNDRFLIVDKTKLKVDETKLTIQNDPSVPMVTFSAVKNANGNKLFLVAARDGTFYGQRSGNGSLGAVLDGLADTATGDMATVLGALDNSGDPQSALTLEPNVNQGAIQTSFGTVGQYTNTVIGRIGQVLAARTSGAAITGISTGDETANKGTWVQGFGSYLHQAATGTSDGYTANVWGVSFGYDTFVFDHVMAGVSGGYARNNVTTKDVNTRTDADSYQGSFYGSLARDAYYFDAVLSFAYNRYDASRHIAFGAIDRTANSNYGGQQYSGYLEGGYAFKSQGFVLTPLVSLQVMRLHLENFTETDAGSLNLNVKAQNYDLFQTGLGAKAAYPIISKDMKIIPELHATFLYDFAGDAQQATSTFTGGGASFVTTGFDPPKSSGNIGAKLTLMTKSNWQFSFNYDFEMKTDFYSHNGYVNVRYEF